MEGNLQLQIDWASVIVGSKFTVFVLLYFVFEGSFPGTLYLEGQFNRGFFASPVWGANIWRGLFLEFYSICKSMSPRVSENICNIYITFYMYVTCLLIHKVE